MAKGLASPTWAKNKSGVPRPCGPRHTSGKIIHATCRTCETACVFAIAKHHNVGTCRVVRRVSVGASRNSPAPSPYRVIVSNEHHNRLTNPTRNPHQPNMLTHDTLIWILAFLIALSTCVTFRILAISPMFNPRPASGSRAPGTPTRLLVVLGSGGHTAEMLTMLKGLDCSRYTHRSYIISSGDAFSAGKAKEFEDDMAKRARKDKDMDSGNWDVSVVPRARNIHQSVLTAPLSCARCLLACFAVLQRPSASSSPHTRASAKRFYPTLIVSNGPATGVMIVLASIMLRFFGFPGANGTMRTIYVESFARVKRLSLSGKLLLGTVDRFVVQWQGLVEGTHDVAEYHGVLV